MRKLLLRLTALAFAGMLLVAAPAVAKDPPSGSKETKNEVKCGKSTAGNGSLKVYAESGYAEVCNDGTTTPVQGRIIVTGGTSGGSIMIDGDESNASQGRGYARINVSSSPSYQCGDSDAADGDGVGNNDSYNPTKNETSADCG